MCGEDWFDVQMVELVEQFVCGDVLGFECGEYVQQGFGLWCVVGVLVVVVMVDVVYMFGDVYCLEVGCKGVSQCFGFVWLYVVQVVIEQGYWFVFVVMVDGVGMYCFYLFEECFIVLFGQYLFDYCVDLVYVFVQGGIVWQVGGFGLERYDDFCEVIV